MPVLNLAYCINDKCKAVFIKETKYVPMAQFCQCCRAIMSEQVNTAVQAFNDLDEGPGNA